MEKGINLTVCKSIQPELYLKVSMFVDKNHSLCYSRQVPRKELCQAKTVMFVFPEHHSIANGTIVGEVLLQ